MKKRICSVFIIVLIVSIFMTSLAPAWASQSEVTPRYVAISQIRSSLSISSSGGATCSGKVILADGYTADLAVKLKQDGTVIKTWTSSGSGVVSAGGLYYVMSGHNYVVTTTATVYNENGKIVEIVFKDSVARDY